ncbi:19827_t:CDS:2 [Cetraspora pellucida]|uniref:19827_t:CDS:1 n=1 Tax=Cetraspora pellucida TaxID=1433469 RepID=A0A9N9HJF7_9GLOM|nr:19827_t:CDS:2 [Cetraspora pellucida]
MSSHGYNPSNVHEAHYLKIQIVLLTPFFLRSPPILLTAAVKKVLTNAELMFDFLEERQRLAPTIFIGIEGSGVSGIASGEDKILLEKWVLQRKPQTNSVIVFEDIFYNTQFPRNQWISYNRKGEPKMFASTSLLDIK